MTSFGSHPHIDVMSQSPPGRCSRQQQEQHGGRRQQSSSTTTFFGENVNDVWQNSPPRATNRLLVPPPYSRQDDGAESSPTRRLFTVSGDDSPSSPLPPSATGARFVAWQPRSPPCSPRLNAIRRNAASDNSVVGIDTNLLLA